MPDQLEQQLMGRALSKAEKIGPSWDRNVNNPDIWKSGEIPMDPGAFGSLRGLEPMLSSIRELYRNKKMIGGLLKNNPDGYMQIAGYGGKLPPATNPAFVSSRSGINATLKKLMNFLETEGEDEAINMYRNKIKSLDPHEAEKEINKVIGHLWIGHAGW